MGRPKMLCGQRRKVEDLLEQLSHTGDGVFAIDSRCCIILWNQAAESLLGYQAGEVLGKRCHEIIRGRDVSGNQVCGQWCNELQEAAQQRWPHHRTIRAATCDSEEIWIDVSTIAVLSPRRELSSLVHIFRETGQPHVFSADSVKASLSPAKQRPIRHKETVDLSLLTKRELTILRHLAEGYGTRSIAANLYISVVTVRNHIQNILQKLGVHSRLEAVALTALLHLREDFLSLPTQFAFPAVSDCKSRGRHARNRSSILPAQD